MALGKTVKSLREALGWTLKDLSKRSGVPVGTIGALEVRDSVRSEYAAKLAKGLGVPVEDLLSATATVNLTASSPTLVATGSASKQPLALAVPVQVATENVSPELTEQCRAVMAMLATLPDDPVVRFQVLGQLAEIIAKARGSPPSHQEPPAYSHAATRAA